MGIIKLFSCTRRRKKKKIKSYFYYYYYYLSTKTKSFESFSFPHEILCLGQSAT